jgi:hypothetical protein
MSYCNITNCKFIPNDNGSYRVKFSVDWGDEFTTTEFEDVVLNISHENYYIDSSKHKCDGIPWRNDGYGESFYDHSWMDDAIIEEYKNQFG